MPSSTSLYLFYTVPHLDDGRPTRQISFRPDLPLANLGYFNFSPVWLKMPIHVFVRFLVLCREKQTFSVDIFPHTLPHFTKNSPVTLWTILPSLLGTVDRELSGEES